MTCECPSCGHASDVEYRCESCGRDLTDVGSSTEERAALGGDGR